MEPAREVAHRRQDAFFHRSMRFLKDYSYPNASPSVLPKVEELSRMRRELGLSQLGLARMAGVSQSLVAKMEKGRVDPSYSSIVRIYNALTEELAKRSKTLVAKDICTSSVVSVGPRDALRKASQLMAARGFSQVPVMEGDQVVGSVTEELVTQLVAEHKDLERMMDTPIERLMEEAFPMVDEHMPIDIVAQTLRHRKAVVVLKKGKVRGVITKSDMLRAAGARGK